MKFGDDKALSLGGSLPSVVHNGLVGAYARLVKRGGPVFVVATFDVNYVKTGKHDGGPDEPVLILTSVEVGEGEDEGVIRDMIDRLQAERTDEPSLASAQGELNVP